MALEHKSRMASSYPRTAAGTSGQVCAGLHPSSADKLAVVIPTLREAANIGGLLHSLLFALAPLPIPFEILVVDDDSGDGIDIEVGKVSILDPRVRLLVRRNARGLAGAILHGWRHTDATLLAVMDADGQHPPGLMPRLVSAVIGGRDLALASRYAHGNRPRAWQALRRALSFSAIVPALPLQRRECRVADPMAGYFVVRRACLDSISFEERGFKLLLEILVRGRVRSVEEVPFAFGRRVAGKSKAGPRIALHYLRLLWKLYRLRWSSDRPLQEAAAD